MGFGIIPIADVPVIPNGTTPGKWEIKLSGFASVFVHVGQPF